MSDTEERPQLPAERKAALVATGGNPTAIIPHSVEEMFRLAEAITRSGLAPTSMNTREKVMVSIMAGAELGMPPWQSVQSFAVIGNRASIWGDAIPALLWSNGFKLREWFENEDPAYPPQMTAHCVVIRPDGTEVPGEFSVADAKEAGLWSKTGPWQTAKKRMLKMRARAFAARDGAADVLRGMQIREEVEDYVMRGEVTETRTSGVRERLRQQQTTSTGFSAEHVEAELHDAETGEVVDAEFDAVKDAAYGEEDDDPQHQGSTATESSESTSEPEPTSTTPASIATTSTASRSETASTDAEGQETGDQSLGAAPEPETTRDPAADGSDAGGVATAASQAGGETAKAPALIWADAVSEDLGSGRFKTVAEIDAFTSDQDNGRYFGELEAVDPGAARRLNAQIKSVRKALASREGGP